MARLVHRFQAGAEDSVTRTAAELSLVMVELGARVLDAVARGADRGFAARSAALLRRAHDLGGDVLRGERVALPDLDAVHRALEGEA